MAEITQQDIDSIRNHLESIQRTLDNAQKGPVAPPPKPQVVARRFFLGTQSTTRLMRLMPQLADCVQAAIKITLVDFTVLQTIRTIDEQKAAVAAGHSRTMQSKHLAQADGFAHAVDLGAWVNGKVDWTPKYYAAIALAMDEAATELGFANHVRWGGAWDRVLSDYGGSLAAYEAETHAYAARHVGSDLIDMPHFEWVS